jgi:hypothetical protein
MSGRRGSNSRQPAWKAGALPTELLPHKKTYLIMFLICECKYTLNFIINPNFFLKNLRKNNLLIINYLHFKII